MGSVLQEVGLLIALGAMLGKLLADSGGADRVIDTLVAKASPAQIPWAMALVAVIIGLPMFFEIGLVLLLPVIVLVTQRSGLRLMRVAIPALAGLSVLHGLVPPHPGPLIAISSVHAKLGTTLALGIVVAIPTVIICGPLFSILAAKWVPVGAPAAGRRRRHQRDRAQRGRQAAAVVPGHAADDPVPGRADAGQGAGRHHLDQLEEPAAGPVVPRLHRRAAGRVHAGGAAGDDHVRLCRRLHRAEHLGQAERERRPDRGRAAHRRRRRRLQAVADRRRGRRLGGEAGQRLAPVGAGARLPGRRRAAAGHRLGHGGDHRRGGHRRPAGRRPLARRTPRCSPWPSEPARCSCRTSTTPGSGWSRSCSG